MHQRFLQCALLASMVLVWGPAQGQSVPPVSVSVQPPAQVQVVLFSADASGKVLVTTDQKGQGSIDGVALAKLGRLDVVEESCGTQKRVLLVASNGKVADKAGCSKRSIGSFASGTDRVLKAELFTPLPRAPVLPDPPPSAPANAKPVVSPQAQPVRPPATTATQPCPSGAGLIGPKLDLPQGGKTFEEADLLSACTYKGIADTENRQWKYFKFSLVNGQTLKITARTRDSNIGYPRYLSLRLHGPDGGQVAEAASEKPSTIFGLEYKATATGFAYLAVADIVRDAAFQVSIQ